MAFPEGGTQKTHMAGKPRKYTIQEITQAALNRFSNFATFMSQAQTKAKQTVAQVQASALADAIRAASASQAVSDSAGSALSKELALKQLALEERQVKVQERGAAVTEQQLKLAQQAQAFQEKDTITERLQNAAALATGPAGAIQLAYMARGQGAPQSAVRNIFQRLPFVQALLQGKALPSFGLPEQLGGAGRTGAIVGDAAHTITGKTFGTKLPTKTAITEQQFSGMSDLEKVFLGELEQTETGESANAFLTSVMQSFVPTTGRRTI